VPISRKGYLKIKYPPYVSENKFKIKNGNKFKIKNGGLALSMGVTKKWG